MSDELNELDLLRQISMENNPRIVSGYRLIMPFSAGVPFQRRDVYYRHGQKHEVREWLMEQVGPTGSYKDWEDGQMDLRWLYTGTNDLNRFKSEQIGYPSIAIYWFRDKGDAMLFKLTWWGRM